MVGMNAKRSSAFSVYQVSGPLKKQHSPTNIMDVHQYFLPLIRCMKFSGCVITREETTTDPVWSKIRSQLIICLRSVYLTVMWIWTVLMTVNIFWLAVAKTDSGVSPVDGQKANMLITLLNESPYSFITIRNAVVLTIYVARGKRILKAVDQCEDLRRKICRNGYTLSMDESLRSAPALLCFSVVLIILWEAHEWTVWFTTLGISSQWNCSPLPVKVILYHYAIIWLFFTTIPFMLSQVSLCFPSLFACTVLTFVQFLNKELAILAAAETASISKTEHIELGRRLIMLRKMHFDITQVVRNIDKLVRAMLLWQFIMDVAVIFGFIGLLISSKDAKPKKDIIEWSFFISSSFVWFFAFLFHFSFPLIRMANEVSLQSTRR